MSQSVDSQKLDSKQICFCPYCGSKLLDPSNGVHCQSCGNEIPNGNPSPQNANPKFIRYESNWSLFGWPLVSIANGMDPKTGKRGIARGLLAIGDVAIGGVALGGVALGGFAFGGCAMGLVAFGGCSIGLLLAMGGVAISLGLGMGGAAMGFIALGGGAIGYYAYGGGAVGMFAESGGRPNQVAREFASEWLLHAEGIRSFITPILAFLLLAPLIVFPFLKKSHPENQGGGDKDLLYVNGSEKPEKLKRSAMGLGIHIALGGMSALCLVWLVLVAIGVAFG